MLPELEGRRGKGGDDTRSLLSPILLALGFPLGWICNAAAWSDDAIDAGAAVTSISLLSAMAAEEEGKKAAEGSGSGSVSVNVHEVAVVRGTARLSCDSRPGDTAPAA